MDIMLSTTRSYSVTKSAPAFHEALESVSGACFPFVPIGQMRIPPGLD